MVKPKRKKKVPIDAIKGHGLGSTIWNGCFWERLALIFKEVLTIINFTKYSKKKNYLFVSFAVASVKNVLYTTKRKKNKPRTEITEPTDAI